MLKLLKLKKEVDFVSEKAANKSIFQFVKFALFSCSAGIIQIGSFTLMNEVLLNTEFMQNLIASNETFAKIMTNEYGPFYLIALILSVLWNFTFNRKFTFKSAANIPVAMLKVFGFYLIFTPVSTVLGNYFTSHYADIPAVEYIVLGVTMACNMITEYLFCKFVVYKNQENTAE
ncbi:MAG: GtrA family protein [Ruminococcaceae bacterium]|nr:GtrA family protein [Oscillospiraceae bacterium]